MNPRRSNHAKYIAVIRDILKGHPYKLISHNRSISIIRVCSIKKDCISYKGYQKLLKKFGIDWRDLLP